METLRRRPCRLRLLAPAYPALQSVWPRSTASWWQGPPLAAGFASRSSCRLARGHGWRPSLAMPMFIELHSNDPGPGSGRSGNGARRTVRPARAGGDITVVAEVARGDEVLPA